MKRTCKNIYDTAEKGMKKLPAEIVREGDIFREIRP
jgi:hypothetical protein